MSDNPLVPGEATSEPPSTSPASGRTGDTPEADAFSTYLAKRFIGEKRFQLGVPEEAAELAERSDIVLSHAELGLGLICILDRERDSKKHFAFSREDLIEIGRACLKYTGTMNGFKMPVGITLYEIGTGPLSESDRSRLKALQKSTGTQKVFIDCFYLDVASKTVWTSAPFNGLLRGRRWVEAVLREPRKRDGDMFVPDAALPQAERRPLATVSLLAFLLVMFVVEHIAKVGTKSSGLLGVDVGTLFALGGMNSDAVLSGGEWYRLLSAACLHGDVFHLVLNGVALGLSGFLLESLLGAAWFLILFFVGALGGSLLGLWVNPVTVVSVGASGAVMGLLAAALVAATRYPPGAMRTQIQIQLFQFLIPSLIPLATYRQGGKIDYAAHFGGAIIGLVAGYLLMKIWPRNSEQPRFPAAAKACATVSVFCLVASLLLVKQNYPAHAAEMAFSAEDLLVEDSKIPQETGLAKKTVDEWGKNHPRDPRVHLFRALRMLEEGAEAPAEAELRKALGDRQILDRAFGNKKLETTLRALLCDLLLQQGRQEEARREAQPVCTADNGAPPPSIRALGLCE